ncbi:large subunit ribosomal protein L23 protein [Dioscorea alata]|uniref:Large subunit ribosomal protein L23 protein n=1 Tax=Dioscorea alata TaxID=55571 RepID=A0ACB7U6P2_DIOAL|nr:large subunit ribosomal protein L23 protein [Dioscorea alata]
MESHHPYIMNDVIKYAEFIETSIWLLGNNQYNSNVKSRSTRTEIKHLRNGRKMGPIMGHIMHYKYIIITLQLTYPMPPLLEKNKLKESLIIEQCIYTKLLLRAYAMEPYIVK